MGTTSNCIERECTVCHVVKPYTEFHKTPPNKGKCGHLARCKSCQTATAPASPGYAKAQRMSNWRKRGMLGVTDEVYDKYMSATHCDVCGTVLTHRRLDHDHDTGAVRGVLCHHCNIALGHAKDDPAILRKLADYLENHYGNPF